MEAQHGEHREVEVQHGEPRETEAQHGEPREMEAQHDEHRKMYDARASTTLYAYSSKYVLLHAFS